MNKEDRLDIARSFIGTQFQQKAIAYLTKQIDEDGSDPDFYSLRGSAYFQIADVEKAIADFNRAIELNKLCDIAYWNLSQVYITKNDYTTARDYIITALSISRNNVEYLTDLVIIESKLKNFENCITACNEILLVNPNDLFALESRGNAFVDLKEFEKAIADFEKILIIDPNDAFNLNNLGFAICYSGYPKESIKYYRKAIDLNPDFAYPYDNMGYVYYLDDELQRAMELINKSIEIDPSNSWAYKNRALVYIKLNKKEKALADLNFALELGYAEIYDNEVDHLMNKLS